MVLREIRADFDAETIVVYQAFNPAIADRAVAAGKFVAPFSLNRMTWIKPSFLWLMERSGWASKPGQERILGVRIRRAGLERALVNAVLSAFDSTVHESLESWRASFASCAVRVQWDPERSMTGEKLSHRSIQVGLGPAIVPEYVHEWIVAIVDLTELTKQIRRLIDAGDVSRAERLLPVERPYEVPPEIAQGLGMA